MKQAFAIRMFWAQEPAMAIFEPVLERIMLADLGGGEAPIVPSEYTDLTGGNVLIDRDWKLGGNLTLTLRFLILLDRHDNSAQASVNLGLIDIHSDSVGDIDLPDFFLWVNFSAKVDANGQKTSSLDCSCDVEINDPSAAPDSVPAWQSILPDWKERFAESSVKDVSVWWSLVDAILLAAKQLTSQRAA